MGRRLGTVRGRRRRHSRWLSWHAWNSKLFAVILSIRAGTVVISWKTTQDNEPWLKCLDLSMAFWFGEVLSRCL